VPEYSFCNSVIRRDEAGESEIASIWRRWSGLRGTKANPVTGDHLLFSFLTTEPNSIVAPIHAKAMPVILTEENWDLWLEGDMADALALQRPAPDDRASTHPARRIAMRPSEKQAYLFSDAFTALCVMRDIDNENPAERVAGDIALFELQMAMEGKNSLTPDEYQTLAGVIAAWRKLGARGNDEDDGQNFVAWNAEIEPLVDALPERKYVEAHLSDVDTLDVEF
jgi:hypothetical protein